MIKSFKLNIQAPKDSLVWYIAVILAACTFFVVYRWANQVQTSADTVTVWTAKTDLEPPKEIAVKDLVAAEIPKRLVPATAFTGTNIREVVGLTLIHPVAAGQILTSNEFLRNRSANVLGAKFPEGKFGIVLGRDWFVSVIPQLAKGDQISIYYSSGTKESSGLLVSGIPVVAVESDKNGISQLMLTVSDEQAGRIMQAKANNVPLVIAVQGAAKTITP